MLMYASYIYIYTYTYIYHSSIDGPICEARIESLLLLGLFGLLRLVRLLLLLKVDISVKLTNPRLRSPPRPGLTGFAYVNDNNILIMNY